MKKKESALHFHLENLFSGPINICARAELGGINCPSRTNNGVVTYLKYLKYLNSSWIPSEIHTCMLLGGILTAWHF